MQPSEDANKLDTLEGFLDMLAERVKKMPNVKKVNTRIVEFTDDDDKTKKIREGVLDVVLTRNRSWSMVIPERDIKLARTPSVSYLAWAEGFIEYKLSQIG
jgi:C4-type Zn-finger protein